MQELKKRAEELLADGTVARVLGWRTGDLAYNPEPAFFQSSEDLDTFTYNRFCGANLSRFLSEAGEHEGKTLVFLKPCDTYSLQQMIKEHRIEREKVYAIAVGCGGNVDMEKVRAAGIKGIVKVVEADTELQFHTLYGDKSCEVSDVLLERCRFCKGDEPVLFDERMLETLKTPVAEGDRFELVAELEAMKPEERFGFWQGELSRCIRCNACRNACPVCTCRKCVFDSDKFDSEQKANSDSFEEKMFHIIRAFHVAGRCTDCGECSRVCPQGIPLYLLNRKFIKDINEFYGVYQAGASPDEKGPLTSFTLEDVEPGIVGERG